MDRTTALTDFDARVRLNTQAAPDPGRCLPPYPDRTPSGRCAARPNTRRLAAALPVLLVVFCFGPYVSLSFGLRTEHFIIYACLPLAFLGFISPRLELLRDQWVWNMFWALSGLLAWTAVVTFALATPEGFGLKLLGSVENYVEPLAVLIVVYTAVSRRHICPRKTLKAAASAYVVLMAANAVVAAICIAVDLSPYLRMFAGFAAVGGRTVMELAFAQGRYTGIFNQPSEAGLSYSLALLCWLYIYGGDRRRAIARTVLFVLILAGGGLSTSKVFFFGGIPFFVAYAVRVRWRIDRAMLVVGTCALAFVLVLPTLTARWHGTAQLSRMAFSPSDPSDVILDRLSAGRLNGEGLVVQSFERVFVEAPLTGFGFAASDIVDSAYNEVFLQGGSPALFLYIAFIATALRVAHQGRRTREGSFLWALSWLVLVAGLGATVITANRVGSVIVTLMTIACCCQRNPVGARQPLLYRHGTALQRLAPAQAGRS